MINKPYNLFIGKDIDRTAALVDGADFTVVSTNIVEGEIVVLDKNMNVLAATATYADSDTIYIAEGTSQTLNYENETGTSLTGRRVLLSNPIDGRYVREYVGEAFTDKVEANAEIPAITDSIVGGTEYVLRLVYEDIEEHPGQFTQTYRYVAKTGDTSQDVFNGLRSRISKHVGSRVIGGGTTTLTLTAKPIPESTSSLHNIDEFKMVNFEVFFNYVTSDNVWEEVGLGSDITLNKPIHGSGNWEQVRDSEKVEKGYRGITNRTHFPVIEPDFRTVKGAEYDIIVIEYDAAYRSPDNSYEKLTTKKVILAFEDPSTALGAEQETVNLTALNSWMASLPGGFAAITF